MNISYSSSASELSSESPSFSSYIQGRFPITFDYFDRNSPTFQFPTHHKLSSIGESPTFGSFKLGTPDLSGFGSLSKLSSVSQYLSQHQQLNNNNNNNNYSSSNSSSSPRVVEEQEEDERFYLDQDTVFEEQVEDQQLQEDEVVEDEEEVEVEDQLLEDQDSDQTRRSTSLSSNMILSSSTNNNHQHSSNGQQHHHHQQQQQQQQHHHHHQQQHHHHQQQQQHHHHHQQQTTDITQLPLPSIFQQGNNTMNPPPILFSPSASLTTPPTFLLPPTPSSMSNHAGNMFPQDLGNYMGMDCVDQFQMHGHPGHNQSHPHFNTTISYPYLYLQQASHQVQQQQHTPHGMHSPQQNTTPMKTVKKRHVTERKNADPSSPVTIPKCTRCNENASWRHDKRRWWCKECKKAFTPGISKPMTSPTHQIQQTNQQVPIGWDMSQIPNSNQNTPPSVPQNPNIVTAVTHTCPSCGTIAGWKHDKKRYHCKTCKKPFTPQPGHNTAALAAAAAAAGVTLLEQQLSMSPQSPTKSNISSPGKKSSKKKGVSSPSSMAAVVPSPTSTLQLPMVNQQPPSMPSSIISHSHLPMFQAPIPTAFLPPLQTTNNTNQSIKDMSIMRQNSPSPINSIPSPPSIMMPSLPQPHITNSLIPLPPSSSTSNNNSNSNSNSPNGASGNSPKKQPKIKKEKDINGGNGNDSVQVLVSVDNGANGSDLADWQKSTKSSIFSNSDVKPTLSF